MKNVLNALDAMLEAYRKKEREFPSYEELAGLLKAPAILVSADPAENEAIARDAQAIVDGDMATFRQGPMDFQGGFRIPRPPEEVAAASAAAPQVVADERVLPPLPQYFPSIVNIRADEELRAQDYATQYARAALQAAPVQPVAVPDGWKWMPIKATGTMADAGAFSGLPVGAAESWIAKQVWEAMAAQSPAALAAQGDAVTEREKFEKHFGPKDNFAWRNADDTYKNGSTQQAWVVWQAAIAAKAAA